MAKVEVKAKELEEAKVWKTACEQAVKDTEAQIASVEEPYDDKIRTLETERDKKTSDLYERLHGQQAKAGKANEDLRKAEVAFNDARWDGVMPKTFEQFVEWFHKVANQKYKSGRYWYGEPAPFKGPKVEGLTIWAGKETKTETPQKVYGAWVTATEEFVGFLFIDPAKHPGDNTDAHGYVGDKQVMALENYWLKKPLAIWVEALNFQLHPDKAPIWKAVKKTEKLPVGAVVRTAYCGERNTYYHGVVTKVDGQGIWFNYDRETTTIYSLMVEKYNPEDHSATLINGNAEVQVDASGNIVTIEQVLKAVV